MTNIAEGYLDINYPVSKESVGLTDSQIDILYNENENVIPNEETEIVNDEGNSIKIRKTQQPFNIKGFQAKIISNNPWTYKPIQINYEGAAIQLDNVKYSTAPSLNEHVIILQIGDWNYLMKTGEIEE